MLIAKFCRIIRIISSIFKRGVKISQVWKGKKRKIKRNFCKVDNVAFSSELSVINNLLVVN